MAVSSSIASSLAQLNTAVQPTTILQTDESKELDEQACSKRYLNSELNNTDLYYLTPFDIRRLHVLADTEKLSNAMCNLGQCYLKGYAGCSVNIKKV